MQQDIVLSFISRWKYYRFY